jgi:predicted phosphodiesterase
MKFRIFADTHLNSPIEIFRNEVVTEPANENTILVGDILDFAASKKEELPSLKKIFIELKNRHGDNYIIGNHCRMGINNETIIKQTEFGTRICFVHGDIEANEERWTKYRQKGHGASFFKRKFIIPFIREAEEIIDRKPKKEILDRMVLKAVEHKCTVYVAGHFHPKETIDLIHSYMGNTVRIIILPRGLTEIEIS